VEKHIEIQHEIISFESPSSIPSFILSFFLLSLFSFFLPFSPSFIPFVPLSYFSLSSFKQLVNPFRAETPWTNLENRNVVYT
jgi:hypothetical protein